MCDIAYRAGTGASSAGGAGGGTWLGPGAGGGGPGFHPLTVGGGAPSTPHTAIPFPALHNHRWPHALTA